MSKIDYSSFSKYWETKTNFIEKQSKKIDDLFNKNKCYITKILNPCKIQNFTFKQGFYAVFNDKGKLLAASSGWHFAGEIYVYFPAGKKNFTAEWINPYEYVFAAAMYSEAVIAEYLVENNIVPDYSTDEQE